MPLSDEERQALKAEAVGLQTDLSNFQGLRQSAIAAKEQELEDEKLMFEVARLREKRNAEAAKLEKLGVNVSAEEAVDLMNAAAIVADTPKTEVPSVPVTGDFGLGEIDGGVN